MLLRGLVPSRTRGTIVPNGQRRLIASFRVEYEHKKRKLKRKYERRMKPEGTLLDGSSRHVMVTRAGQRGGAGSPDYSLPMSVGGFAAEDSRVVERLADGLSYLL